MERQRIMDLDSPPPIVPKRTDSFLDFSPLEVARQMTLLEADLFWSSSFLSSFLFISPSFPAASSLVSELFRPSSSSSLNAFSSFYLTSTLLQCD